MPRSDFVTLIARLPGELYRRLVLHCVGLIALGRLDEALSVYRARVLDLGVRYLRRADATRA